MMVTILLKSILKGAKNCVLSKNNLNISKNKITKVKIQCPKRLALLKRYYTNGVIIGVTGSSGKTSVKNLLEIYSKLRKLIFP